MLSIQKAKGIGYYDALNFNLGISIAIALSKLLVHFISKKAFLGYSDQSRKNRIACMHNLQCIVNAYYSLLR